MLSLSQKVSAASDVGDHLTLNDGGDDDESDIATRDDFVLRMFVNKLESKAGLHGVFDSFFPLRNADLLHQRRSKIGLLDRSFGKILM